MSTWTTGHTWRARPCGMLRSMADYLGRVGRRADLARILHATPVEHGMSPRDGAARAIIDQTVSQVAAELGVSEAAALKHLDDRTVIELAVNTANTWHASQVADEVAGGVVVQQITWPSTTGHDASMAPTR